MTRPRILFLAILSLVLLLAGSVALAAPVPNNHPNVVVRDAAGAAITNGTTPYSPKQTCAGCHIDNCISTASCLLEFFHQGRSGGIGRRAAFRAQ